MKWQVFVYQTITTDGICTVGNRYKVIILTVKSNGPLLKAVT